MLEVSDELVRKIVREALLELGSDADPVVLRKIVIAVIRRLTAREMRDEITKTTSPPQQTQSQY